MFNKLLNLLIFDRIDIFHLQSKLLKSNWKYKWTYVISYFLLCFTTIWTFEEFWLKSYEVRFCSLNQNNSIHLLFVNLFPIPLIRQIFPHIIFMINGLQNISNFDIWWIKVLFFIKSWLRGHIFTLISFIFL